MSFTIVCVIVAFVSANKKLNKNANIVEKPRDCDVLHSNEYAFGSWKFTKSPRDWRYCYETVQSLNELHQNLFCHGGHGAKVIAPLPPLEWVPQNCTLRRFSSRRFVDSLNAHRVHFVGDSVTAQQYFNLRCFLEQDFKDDLLHEYYKLSLRNESTNVTLANYEPSHMLYKIANGQIDYQQLDGWRYTRRMILVLNTGAWYNQLKLNELGLRGTTHKGTVSSSDADAAFRAAIDTLFNATLVDFRGVVLFRSITPGHINGCSAVHSPLFDWDSFDLRNQYIRDAIKRRNNTFFIDVEQLSELRPDAHPGSVGVVGDCYHWCSPDPHSVINFWNGRRCFIIVWLIFDDEPNCVNQHRHNNSAAPFVDILAQAIEQLADEHYLD